MTVNLVQTQIGMWHPDNGFISQENYDRIIGGNPEWDDVGYVPAFILLPRKEVSMSETTEWCVVHPSFPNEMHRGPFTEREARAWVDEVVDGDPTRVGLFHVAKRTVTTWELA